VYLEGQWKNNPHNIELQGETGRIVLNYSAKSVNIVAGGTPGTIERGSTDSFTNISDQSIPLLSTSSSPISLQKEMEILGSDISD
jgi:hypothetical protein